MIHACDASFQQDKPNPFVLDSTLIRRAYPELSPVSNEDDTLPAAALSASPNPFRDFADVRLTLDDERAKLRTIAETAAEVWG